MNPLLYEVHTRQWLAELGVRDLASVSDVTLDALSALGVTHLWLMGIWPVGRQARELARTNQPLRKEFDAALPGWTEDDVAGSPYAIGDYRVADEFGGPAALAALRARLHRRGIGVILDFVPNHVAIDHPWVTTNKVVAADTKLVPDMFAVGKRFVANGKDPNFAGWSDTAQLEYRRKETRDAMQSVLRSIADQCDGVRCDMAMLVMPDIFEKTWHAVQCNERAQEFWSGAIANVKQQHSGFLFLAEAYWGLEAKLCADGFDYAYDKELYDRLVHDRPFDVQPHLLDADNTRRAHFIENHDEPRAANMPLDLHRAAALLVLGLPGMRFLHHAQTLGAKRFARIQLRRRAVEPIEPNVRAIYDQLLPAIRASSVGQGTGQLLAPQRAWDDNSTNSGFVIVKWDRDLVVVNLARHRAQCRVVLPDVSGRTWELVDRLSSESWVRSGDEMATAGLYLDVAARGAQLFVLR